MPLRPPVALFAALLLLALGALPARSADFTDAAGRRVALPDRISRVMPAERDAEVLLYVLAPDKLAGIERGSLRRGPAGLPALGWRPRAAPTSMAETARRLRPDLIIDAGAVTAESAAFADQVQQLSGIPYILVSDSFARTPAILRSIAVLLGVRDRGEDLALFAEHAIAGLRGRLLIQSPDARPRVYYARGFDGLSTALPGSPAAEAIDEAGAINVAASLGRGTEVTVTPDQLYSWNPTIILAEGRRAYDALHRSPQWRRLAAVRQNRVYLIPSSPFGWVEDPSGVNRLIGLYWLSGLFYADATQEDLRTTACDFYDKFYRVALTNGQLEAMLRPAGVPPAEIYHPVGEPLIGLGAAPPSALPEGTPGAVKGAGTAASNSPELVGGMAGPLRSGGPSQSCVVPHGASPVPLDQLPGLMNPPSAAPGVPPPGRRGRPTALVTPPAAEAVASEGTAAPPISAAARNADTASGSANQPDSAFALRR